MKVSERELILTIIVDFSPRNTKNTFYWDCKALNSFWGLISSRVTLKLIGYGNHESNMNYGISNMNFLKTKCHTISNFYLTG